MAAHTTPRASAHAHKSGGKKRTIKEEIEARLLKERQHASRKEFRHYFRSVIAQPRSGARNVEVRPEFTATISASTFEGTKPGVLVYFGAYDCKGRATGEEWNTTFEGTADLIPKEFRSSLFSTKRLRTHSDDESSASESEEEEVEVDNEDEAPQTDAKGKGKATAREPRKPERRVPSAPRKARRVPTAATKRARRAPVSTPAQNDAEDENATQESHLGQIRPDQSREPLVASTSGTRSTGSSAAAAAPGPIPVEEEEEQRSLGRGKRITRGLYGRPRKAPTTSQYGPAFASTTEESSFTFTTPAFQASPRKSPRSIGGESELARLCAQVDDLGVASSAASTTMETGACLCPKAPLPGVPRLTYLDPNRHEPRLACSGSGSARRARPRRDSGRLVVWDDSLRLEGQVARPVSALPATLTSSPLGCQIPSSSVLFLLTM